LVQAVFEAVRKNFFIEKNDKRFLYIFRADSGAFHSNDGRKLGYGSSAALAVALVTACLGLLGILKGRDEAQNRAHIARIALDAHRIYQGGGSGYDVYASAYGGLGIFRQATGDGYPEWECLPALAFPAPFFLVRGEASVQSKAAVRDFASWCADDPVREARFVRISNRAAVALARTIHEAACTGYTGAALAPSPPKPGFAQALRAARRAGLYIGRALGRDPEPRGGGDTGMEARLEGLRALGFLAKASGAGGELAFAFRASLPYTSPDSARGILNHSCIESAEIAYEGVRWR
jgi:mevalonate kinase